MSLLSGRYKIFNLIEKKILNYKPINKTNFWFKTLDLKLKTVDNNLFNIKKNTNVEIKCIIMNLPKYNLLVSKKNVNKFIKATETFFEIIKNNKNIFEILV